MIYNKLSEHMESTVKTLQNKHTMVLWSSHSWRDAKAQALQSLCYLEKSNLVACSRYPNAKAIISKRREQLTDTHDCDTFKSKLRACYKFLSLWAIILKREGN